MHSVISQELDCFQCALLPWLNTADKSTTTTAVNQTIFRSNNKRDIG